MPVRDSLVDVTAVRAFIERHGVRQALIEAQQVRGRQRGGLRIGTNFGRLTAVLDLCGVAWHTVTPQAWQRAMLPAGFADTKTASVTRCRELGLPVPPTSARRDARPHDGVADANLIAYYGEGQARREKPADGRD